MKINILKIFAIAALMIFLGAEFPWQMVGKVMAANVVTPMATTSMGDIRITSIVRPGRFTLSAIIGRL